MTEEKQTTGKLLKKDKECIRCEHIFDCEGKPVGIKRCINMKERSK